ncbi:hypothetical protein [Methanolobus vulcani]|uniref:Uncharacterized protein n=1 Tax=Methanolobus vulcani TaxID=38026 RepID=A0A7Z8KMW3_9EURY|nr:hypothetical protein [Methanolobus vulcani]TQD23524.1 hypothetical protein FKV42_13445 [Methanolobus vulcani]
MDVRSFIKKQEAALKRYRRLYTILDFLGTAIILYLLLFYIHVDEVFQHLPSFEVRAGTSYDILGMDIAFGTVALAIIAIFLSLLITFLRHLRDHKEKAIMLIEQQYPELSERLRTAYDNAGVENLIVSDLVSTVSSGISKISSSTLLIKGKLIFGLIIILVSSTTVVYVVDNDVRTDAVTPEDIAELIEDLPFVGGNDDTNDGLSEFGSEEDEEVSESDSNMTQETDIIVYDGVDVDLTLSGSSAEGFVNEENATDEDVDFEKSSAYETSVISAQAYYEDFPEGYESIIKSYFEELANA